jgi:hypothetical protein
MAGLQFREIVRVNLEENLDLVISERADGLFSAAQQRFTTVHGRRSGMWVKNALIVSADGLEEAANAFMAALDYVTAEKAKNAKRTEATELQAS